MSLQSSNLKEEYIPLNEIRRPIPPVLDYQKIDAMVSTLQGNPMASATCGQGKNYYFAFGGCHRFQAYDKLSKDGEKVPMVKARILPATRKTLKVYLGGSVDEMFKD
ncbi:hypothetical protein CA7LBN_001849 [Candidozyma auris]|uniref:Sulfiredoxin n=1 Tax=Candidozyma auris TaxID=498019 RepID=A0A8F3AFU2_CANAR|nr:hypothetical protein CA7LBN_001849 [[Candida] auris]